jgi:hypothetical protein
MNIDYKIEPIYGSVKLDSWITKEGVGMCRKTLYDEYGSVIECKQKPTGLVIKDMDAWKEIKSKKKINWLRIFTAVNSIVLAYLFYLIVDVYKLCYDIGSANVFMAKIFTFVYHLAERGIRL